HVLVAFVLVALGEAGRPSRVFQRLWRIYVSLGRARQWGLALGPLWSHPQNAPLLGTPSPRPASVRLLRGGESGAYPLDAPLPERCVLHRRLGDLPRLSRGGAQFATSGLWSHATFAPPRHR